MGNAKIHPEGNGIQQIVLMSSLAETKQPLRLLIVCIILFDAVVLVSVSLNALYTALAFLGLFLFSLLVRHPDLVLATAVNGYFLFEVIGKPFEKHNELMLATKLVCICGLIVLWWRYRASISFVFEPIFILTLALGFVLFAGITHSGAPRYGLYKTSFYFLNNVFVLTTVAFLLAFRKKFERFLIYAIAFGVVIGVAGLVKLGLGLEQQERLTVFEINPIWLSRSLGLSIILLYPFFAHSIGRRRVLFVCLAFLLFMAMAFTGSRGPIIALLMMLIVYYFAFSKQSWPRKISYTMITVLAVVTVFVLLPESVTSRYLVFGGRKDISGLMRLVWFDKILPVIESNYLVGIGTGGFSKLIMGADIRAYPHNLFAEIGLENGVVGLLVLGLFLYMTLTQAVQQIRRMEERTISIYATCAILVFVFALSNAMFSGDSPMNEQIWLASGIVLGLRREQTYA